MVCKIGWTGAALIAMALSTVVAKADADGYAACARTKSELYSYYCFALPDIILAVRGGCRTKLAGMLDGSAMDASDKARLIDRFVTVHDERIAAQVLDARIANKVDCGQYNNVATPNIVDEVGD